MNHPSRDPSAPACRALRLPSAFLLLLLLAAPSQAASQTPAPVAADSLFELRRADGSKEIGRVVAERGDTMTFETLVGDRLEVQRRFVRIRPARGRLVEGEFWPEDQHTTRLFFAPTARPIRKGAGYAGLFFVLPFMGYGVTDDISFAGGVPLIGSLTETPVWIAPKVRVLASPSAQVSAGVFAIRIPGEDTGYCEPSCVRGEEARWNGIAYGIGTLGDDENALHAGAGYMFGEETKFPIMVGGERRVSRRNKVITENWLLPGDGAAASFGLRRLGERWTIDYGLMFLFGGGAEEVPYFPILSFSYGFGGR